MAQMTSMDREYYINNSKPSCKVKQGTSFHVGFVQPDLNADAAIQKYIQMLNIL